MDKIEELLTRGVDKIYPSKEALEKVLRSGKKLRLYQGFDPTGTQLHIGHMIGLRKLRQFQDLGHEVIFLIGDFTGRIGDPSGKSDARKPLTKDVLEKNAKEYKRQVSKILNFSGSNPIIIKYNSEWHEKMTYIDFINLIKYFSVAQIVERDMFQKRMQEGKDLFMNEFLYPLLQAYDSVAMDVDLEVGGSDQLFNMMTGRDLMHKMKRKEKFVMTTPLLIDSQGRKIGKTEGNVIALTDEPSDLFGKIMSLSDDVVIKAFEYLTTVPMDEIAHMEKSDNPMANKKKLSFEIVKDLNDENAATAAQEHFEKTVQRQETPEDIPVSPSEGPRELDVIDLLVETKLATSKSEARRLVEQGGVKIDGKTIDNSQPTITTRNGMIIQAGKRKYIKIKVSS